MNMKNYQILQKKLAEATSLSRRYLILFLFIYSIFPVFSATYYVSSSQGNDSNSGMSPQTPWKKISKVNAVNFVPGDTILFRRGDVWKDGTALFFTESGTVANPIVVSAYGTGNKPLFSDIRPLKDWNVFTNWTAVSNNIWKMKYPDTPNRLWLNNNEVLTSVILKDVGTKNSQGTFEWWYYNKSDSSLYLYSIGNPATKFMSIEGNNPAVILALYNCSHLIINGLDLRGGRWSTMYIASGSYINISNCNIGYGLTGISITNPNPAGFAAHHITIENNIFDSAFNFYYGLSSNNTNGEKRGSEDAITLTNAVNNCIIRNNKFTGWGHAAINGYCKDTVFDGIHHNKIYYNTFSGSNNSYNRPIGLDGVEGRCCYNEFYNNTMKDHKVRSQINGNNNWVHHNIFDGQTTSPAKFFGSDGSGQALELSTYSINYVSHHNKIDNNLFINTTEAALVIRSYGSNPNKSTNHYIRNNIFYNTGYKTALVSDSGVAIKLTSTLETYNNVFQKNCIYNPGKPMSNAVKYYGVLLTAAQFNISNSGNIVSGNIQSDPLFVDYSKDDYHLIFSSPCVDAGVIIFGLITDMDGNVIYSGTTADIGPYEYTLTLGINASWYSANDVSVYPNPFSSSVWLESITSENKLVQVFTISGELLLTKFFSGNMNEIDMQNQSSGAYIIKITSNNKTLTSKVIKE